MASGWAEDGCIEAIEWADDDYWLVAVQYHPEDLHPGDSSHLRLFTTFLDRARQVRRGREDSERITPASEVTHPERQGRTPPSWTLSVQHGVPRAG